MADWQNRATPVNLEPGGWQGRASPVENDEETVRKYLELEDQYGGVSGSLKAGALGAADAATFGLSTQGLVKSGMVNPDTIKKLEEANPAAYATGQVAGIGASLLLAPEISLPGLVAKGGAATARGAAAALPKATGLAGKVIQGAGSAALGSAVEGAAYGAGQVIREEALGDPELNGEKILSEIGYGAAIGGLFGAALGGTASLAKEKFPQFISSVAQDAGLDKAINAVPEAEREGIISGMRKLKANANDIKAAAAELDAPVLESQISASKAVQDLDSLLINNPASPIGIARQQMLQEGLDKAEQAAMSTLESGMGRTQVEIGDAIKDSLTKAIQAENEPIAALYNTIKQSTDHIPVDVKIREMIPAEIKKLEYYKFDGSLERKFGDRLISDLNAIQTVDDIKRYSTMLSSETNAMVPGERYAVQKVVEKLKNLEESSIVRAAEKMAEEAGDPAIKANVLQLIDERKMANSAYKALRGKMEELGEVLGKKRISGTADFLEFIDDISPEKLTSKLFAKKNVGFLKFFSENFPEQMQMVKDYEKGRLLSMTGMIKDERLNVAKLITEVNKLGPEVKSSLFDPAELRRLDAVKTYIEAIPKNMNPSGTSHAIAARDFLQKVFGSWKEAGAGAAIGGGIAGPPGAILGGVAGAAMGQSEILRDYGIKKILQAAVSANEKGGMESIIRRLSTVERVINNATNSVDSFTGRVLKSGVQMVHGVKNAILPLTAAEKMKEFTKIESELKDKTKGPEAYLETISSATNGMYDIAPQTSGTMQMALTKATDFLKSKLPNTDPPAPLSPARVPSAAEVSKFMRYYAVVENPYLVLKQVKDGSLTPESMEVMQTVYPRLLGEMQSSLFDKMTSKKQGGMFLPYNTKLMLSAFFGKDLVASMSQQGLMLNQMSYAMPSLKQDNIDMANVQAKKPTQKGMESLTLAERSQTGTRSVIERRQNG